MLAGSRGDAALAAAHAWRDALRPGVRAGCLAFALLFAAGGLAGGAAGEPGGVRGRPGISSGAGPGLTAGARGAVYEPPLGLSRSFSPAKGLLPAAAGFSPWAILLPPALSM